MRDDVDANTDAYVHGYYGNYRQNVALKKVLLHIRGAGRSMSGTLT